MTARMLQIACAALLLAAAPLAAQETPSPWVMDEYEVEGETRDEEIQNRIDDGYLPVGMEVAAGEELWLLYIHSDSLPFDQFLIVEYSQVGTLEAEMSSMINTGWVPVDLARYKNGMLVFFINTDAVTVGDWGLSMTLGMEQTIEQTYREAAEAGYSPWGLTSDDSGTLWFLFLSEPNRESPRPVSLSYHEPEEDAFEPGVNAKIGEGWIPWGMMFGPENIYFQYTN